MPPVRWRRWFYVMTILVKVTLLTDAQQMQGSIAMSSDGWRPILGTRRQPSKSEAKITQYANPNQVLEVVQADMVKEETTTQPLPQNLLGGYTLPVKGGKQVTKLKPQTKTTSPYITIPAGSHGPHIPIGASQHNQQIKKHLQAGKKSAVYGKPRKPIRGQALAHSSRNEIFVPAPPNTGSYSFVKSVSPNNIKTRDAQGLGLLGGSHFGFNQANPHIEFTNRFPDGGLLQRPAFLFAKPLQNDEFTRNLVPPPRRTQANNKDKTKVSLYAFKEGPATEASTNFQYFGIRPNQFTPQASSSFNFAQQNAQKNREQAVDVQVTKENLKQFGTPNTFGPSRNNFPIEYVDYDFHPGKPKPSNVPNTLTYEVTEGKWLDTPSHGYQFRPHNAFIMPQKITQFNTNARPGLLFQDVSSTRPPFFQAPLVDLNVPAFLPTPYKPESAVIPTSPTQSEVSTVYSQVSTKMNRHRNNQLKQNPLYFDIKEVSTHYPILGSPENLPETGTDSPLPIKENGEISTYEITTLKELEKETNTRQPTRGSTKPTSTRDPTKTRISNRRPRPRKPSTTTTEDPVVDMYEQLKSQVNEEVSAETEKPQRRRRPKPTQYRVKETNLGDEEEKENNRPVNEESSTRQRGRYRYRQRERPSTERNDVTSDIIRKRIRPSYFGNTIKKESIHGASMSSEDTTEISMEYSYERDPTVDGSSYSDESSQIGKGDSHVNSQRFETELPDRHYETTEEQTPAKQDSPFIEEIHPLTERLEVYEISKAPIVSSTTESESSTLFHVPENEIDYTTHSPEIQEEVQGDLGTHTITTPPPTTTTTEVTTAKFNRIRGRPNKYDSSNRPRFSVKDYRQRLNQYTSTTPSSSTTQAQKERSTPDTLRLRFPSRLRTRPTPIATTAISRVDEDSTEEPTTTIKIGRFRPKDPRHQATTESDLIITENSVKAINTRLRPFGRPRATTEATTSPPKISIRPNLFSSRRRAQFPSLKMRIQNKNKNDDNEEAEDTSTTPQVEDIEQLRVTESMTTQSSTSTTDIGLNQITEEASTEFTESTTEDIMTNDAMFYSQRVSDLTSSFKDYDRPGLFKSVAPTSRSIPNYFTISTDDPILPIEAFFPNLKDKEKSKE